jgi:DNA-binding NarL/FixJ family response regulator
MAATIKVLICPGSNVLAADLVAGLLTLEPDFTVTSCEGCAEAGQHPDPRAHVDVVVTIASNLLSTDATAQIAQARRLHPAAPLVVLSLDADAYYHRMVEKMGAASLVALDRTPEVLPPTIRQLTAPAPGPQFLPGAIRA